MDNIGNALEIRQDAERQKTQLWDNFERRRGELEEIARVFYPAAVSGLVDTVERQGEKTQLEGDDDRYRLTTMPMQAFQVGVSGFYVNITSPAKRWCTVRSRPESFSTGSVEESTAKPMDELTEAMRYLMRRCGVYKSIHTCWKHLLAFGFGCIHIRPETKAEMMTRGRYLVTECLRIGTYALGADQYGTVDRVLRHFSFNAEQLAEQFGRSNLPESVLHSLDRGDIKTQYEVWNLIEPHREGFRKDSRAFRLSYSDFTYRSIYWLNTTQGDNSGVLAVRGYALKPFVAPRFEVEAGDVYGRGRGADCLGLAKGLQTMREDALDCSGQNAQPAVCASDELKGRLHLGRGGVNWVAAGEQKANAVYRALQEPASTSECRSDAEILMDEIKNRFFNSEFAGIDALKSKPGVKTATEIEYIRWDNFNQLSGIATAMDDEFLDPLATLFMRYTLDLGLANIPADMTIDKMEIHYESDVHKAQNAADINARNASASFAAQLAAARPDLVDNFDLDAMVRAQHRVLGAPEQDLNTPEKREQIRAERANEAARQQQLAEAGMQAKTMKDIASAPVSPGTYGGELMAALAGAVPDGNGGVA